MTAEDARKALADVPGWELYGSSIRRQWMFKDFKQAIAFINAVANLAEVEGHHPDIHLTGWNKVELVLSTHAISGLSENDFIVATKINNFL